MAAAMADYQKPDLTTEEIALKHGISSATLTVWAKKVGVPLRRRGRRKYEMPTPRQREILRLASVYRYDEVGKRFGVSKQCIHQTVQRWREWVQPRKPPFEKGDRLLWRGKKFTVLEANLTDGTLVDDGGKVYKNFVWGGGRMPKRIGTVNR
jgi:hypothetical protein